MNPVQTEVCSTHLSDQLNRSPNTPESSLREASSPTLPPEISQKLGSRFSADLQDVLLKRSSTRKQQSPSPPEITSSLSDVQQVALAQVRAGKIEAAIRLIERHAPAADAWLKAQIRRFHPRYPLEQAEPAIKILPNEIAIVPDGILIDAELARIAKVIGQFSVYRAWAYAHAADDGDGWIERKELEKLWQSVGVARSKRQARRILEHGIIHRYWTQDKATKRVYLTGQVKLSRRILEHAILTGFDDIIATNLPGKKRVQVDLSGSMQEASAKLYAAWHVAKDPDRSGTTISREALCALWRVSIPTLLTWEEIAGIGKRANFAQSNDTSIANLPAHAYLTLNRDGTHSAAWRLPNTYFVNDKTIQQHPHIGKAQQVRQSAKVEIAIAQQRGWIGDAALPSLGRRYFDADDRTRKTAFQACNQYLRHLSRKGGDVFQRRYFCVGSRHGVRIYEPYNIQTNMQETSISQRFIWQEGRGDFQRAKVRYRRNLVEHARYLEALSR